MELFLCSIKLKDIWSKLIAIIHLHDTRKCINKKRKNLNLFNCHIKKMNYKSNGQLFTTIYYALTHRDGIIATEIVSNNIPHIVSYVRKKKKWIKIDTEN